MEDPVYESNLGKVTSERVLLGNRVFNISEVNSAQLIERRRVWLLPWALLLLLAASALGRISNWITGSENLRTGNSDVFVAFLSVCLLMTGLLVLLGSIAVHSYVVRLVGVLDTVDVVTSADKAEAQRLVNAVNRATNKIATSETKE